MMYRTCMYIVDTYTVECVCVCVKCRGEDVCEV